MIRGIYGTRFTSNGQDMGGGIVVIDGTAVHGGDPDYLYRGHYWLQDDHRIEATVHVQNYTGRLNALVGPLSSFELTLTGSADSKAMRLSGFVNGPAPRSIQITLTRIGELIDPSMGCFDAACAVVATTNLDTPHSVAPCPHRATGTNDSANAKRPRRRTRNW